MKDILHQKIQCKSAIGKCGFPGGGLAINSYVGCAHNCAYCYARFMKRFSGHSNEKWGSFVDAKINIVDVLEKQLKRIKNNQDVVYIGTVTDPYQPCEEEYKLTRSILEKLVNSENPVSILTKSDLILRDLDVIKKIKKLDVSFTINSLDEKWASFIEPNAPAVRQRLDAAKKLADSGIPVYAMMGPFWPIFTNVQELFFEFKKSGIKHVFSESLNTTGGNWLGVEEILKKHYPELLEDFKKIYFDDKNFKDFHTKAWEKIDAASKKYKIPTTVYFAPGHAANKFK